MAFCEDREDVVSLSLTAVHQLLEKYGVDAANIGRSARCPTAQSSLQIPLWLCLAPQCLDPYRCVATGISTGDCLLMLLNSPL